MFMIVNFLLKHSSKRKGGGSPKLTKHIYNSIALSLTNYLQSSKSTINKNKSNIFLQECTTVSTPDHRLQLYTQQLAQHLF